MTAKIYVSSERGERPSMKKREFVVSTICATVCAHCVHTNKQNAKCAHIDNYTRNLRFLYINISTDWIKQQKEGENTKILICKT